MEKTLTYIITLLLLSVSTLINAQQFRSSYFPAETAYSHHLNPAFMPTVGYFSIPGLGQAGVGMQSSFDLSNILYPSIDPEYSLTTFMHPSVDADQFLDDMSYRSEMDMNIKMMPLTFGFYAFGGFNSFTVAVNSHSMFSLPLDFFDLVKKGPSGTTGKTYMIDDLHILTNNYIDVGVGHAREITDRLSAGAKVKTYIGIGAMDVNISKLHISMQPDKWEIASAASLNVYADGVVAETESDENGDYFSGINSDSFRIGGIGVGLDLGATYEPMDNLTLSASILDLGFITWGSAIKAQTRTNQFEFDGFDNLSFMDDNENDPNSIDNQFEELFDDLTELTRMNVEPEESRYRYSIPTTMILGMDYQMPFYQRLSVGLMLYTKFNKYNPWSEGRFAVNYSPADFFSMTVNYGVSKYGHSMGWVLNLNPGPINLYFGTDNMIGNVTPQYVPINRLNASVFMGVNYTFGR